jgi:holliday junction DNA helicase RuvB
VTTDNALRPLKLADYVGQPNLVTRLRVLLDAARARGEVTLPHILLQGPGGLGKTTLAAIVASEMGSKAHVAMGPGIEKPPDVFALLQQIQPGDVLFIDEVHRLPAPCAEHLYTALEDGVVFYPYPTAAGVKPVRIVLPPFTCIGATTEPELLEAPMRMRFGATLTLTFYAPADLAVILAVNARKLALEATDDALRVLAARARGTPRVANHLLRFARDLACIEGTSLTVDVAERSLTLQQIDNRGLTDADRSYLRVLQDTYGGGPAGVEALAATIGCKPGTVASVIEPYLLQTGLVKRTHRGRILADAGRAHLAAYEAAHAPADLFAA